jgi:hypothetical protein
MSLAFALVGCSGSGSEVAPDVARAVGCVHYTTTSSTNGVTMGECTYRGHLEHVTLFPSKASTSAFLSRDGMPAVRRLLSDGRWVVNCRTSSDCRDFKAKVGGTIH